MNFKKCSISGEVFGESNEEIEESTDENSPEKFIFKDERLTQEIESEENETIRDFMRAMSVCHSVLPEKSRGGSDKDTF